MGQVFGRTERRWLHRGEVGSSSVTGALEASPERSGAMRLTKMGSLECLGQEQIELHPGLDTQGAGEGGGAAVVSG